MRYALCNSRSVPYRKKLEEIISDEKRNLAQK
jgi:hypothetical protein